MKIQILDINGKKKSEITTNLFEEPIREDLIFKVIESERSKHPNAPRFEAGMARSASGIQRKRRHVWKTDRGRGLSRIPRKIMWRRGTQFSWEGAIIPSAKGGRRAHPPKKSIILKKINKKELIKALLSGLTYTNSDKELKKKYFSLKDKQITLKLPLVVEEKILELKTKDFLSSLKKILGDLYNISIKKKSIRAGIGKLRGRKYKSNSGLLLVIGKNERKKIKGIEIINSNELMVTNLADNGARLVMFTENAIKDLEKILIDNESKERATENKHIKEKPISNKISSKQKGRLSRELKIKDKNKEKKK
jgi:large subunit ribosomal protein L4e